jgi:hypothetical protein
MQPPGGHGANITATLWRPSTPNIRTPGTGGGLAILNNHPRQGVSPWSFRLRSPDSNGHNQGKSVKWFHRSSLLKMLKVPWFPA